MPDNDDILDELEEGLNKIDEEFNKMENQANKTRRKAKTSLKDWYNKGNEWILSNLVAVMFFIVAMTALVLYLNPALPKFEMEKVKKVISVPVKAITEKQEPNNNYKIDLDKMEVNARVVIPLKDAYGKVIAERFIVKRRFIGNDNVSQFVTIKEPLEALNYNKYEYDIYLKNQAEKTKEIK